MYGYGLCYVYFFFSLFRICYCTTLDGSGDYTIPGVCYNLTCSYTATEDIRSTVYQIGPINTVIIHSVSQNICAYNNIQHCSNINICSCDGNATHLCYLHTSGTTGLLNMTCSLNNGQRSSITTIIAAGPSEVSIFPSTPSYTVTEIEGSVGPIYCTAACTPKCAITWTGPRLAPTSVLNLQNITKNQAGDYHCTASNIVNSSQSSTVKVIVQWKPTLDNDIFSSPPLIGLKIGMLLNITAHVLSNPFPSVQWTFEQNGLTSNITALSNNTYNGFLLRSNIIISSINSKQFGTYTTIIRNSIGTFTKSFSVILKEQPTASNHVHAVCKFDTAVLIWRSAFNGGSEQHFNVEFWKKGELVRSTLRHNISDPGLEFDTKFIVKDLTQDTQYWFSIIAINELGSSNSKPVNCTTDRFWNAGQNVSNCQDGTGLFATGIFAIFLAVVIVLISTIVRRLRSKKKKAKRSEIYIDLNTTNTSSTDAYTTLQERGTKKTNAENRRAYDECYPPQEKEIETIYNN